MGGLGIIAVRRHSFDLRFQKLPFTSREINEKGFGIYHRFGDTKEMERLRSVPFLNFQNGTEGNFNCGNNGDPDLTKLRAGCLARIVTDYGDGPPINSSTKIVQVTVEVRWNNDNNVQKNLRMDTLIYASGL